MTPYDRPAARKRPINLTLNEDLVSQVRDCKDNLSALVESLLAAFLDREQHKRSAEMHLAEATVATWNRFAEEFGSFADEHLTL